MKWHVEIAYHLELKSISIWLYFYSMGEISAASFEYDPVSMERFGVCALFWMIATRWVGIVGYMSDLPTTLVL